MSATRARLESSRLADPTGSAAAPGDAEPPALVVGDYLKRVGRGNVGARSLARAEMQLLFGAMLAFVLMITSIGLHSLLRNGGWLRERIDRLRAPIVP